MRKLVFYIVIDIIFTIFNLLQDLQAKRNVGLSLAAYLIKPVQRITKYQLLLKVKVFACIISTSSDSYTYQCPIHLVC